MKPFPVRKIPHAACACLAALFILGGATPDESTSTPDSEDLASLIGIIPRDWSPERKQEIASSMSNIQSYGTTYMGLSLAHARFDIETAALDSLLQYWRERADTFESINLPDAAWRKHPFGQRSHHSCTSEGKPLELDWWVSPDSVPDTGYHWHFRKVPSKSPRMWYWLHVTKLDDKHQRVYHRFSSD